MKKLLKAVIYVVLIVCLLVFLRVLPMPKALEGYGLPAIDTLVSGESGSDGSGDPSGSGTSGLPRLFGESGISSGISGLLNGMAQWTGSEQSADSSGSAASNAHQAQAPSAADASTAPQFNAKVTQKNLLKLMHVYDPDAYYILKARADAGDDFKEWLKGNKHVADAADTTTHEEFHSFAYANAGSTMVGGSYLPVEQYYLGNGKTREVRDTQTFKSSEAASHIPQNLRTFRYNRYVSESATVTANVNGVYGMLNEFSAYYWGMHAAWSLYPYLQNNVSTYDGFSSFVSSYQNGRDAYAEFYYWTLVYLDYARKNNPDTYQAILSNRAYAKTFKDMRKKYERLIDAYGQDVDQVNAYYPSVTRVVSTGAYQKLLPQIKSDKYREVRRALSDAA